MEASSMLVDLIRNLIKEELEQHDNSELCIIRQYDALTDRYSVSFLPDRETVVSGIINASKYSFESGDFAILYKMGNRLSNAFLIAKVNPNPDEK